MHERTPSERLTAAELQALVALLQRGELPIDRQVQLYSTVRRIALRILGRSGPPPEQVVGDTVAAAVLALKSTYRPERGAVTTFVAAVGCRKGRTAAERHRQREERLGERAAAGLISDEPGPLEAAVRAEEREMLMDTLQRAMECLTSRQREAFELWRDLLAMEEAQHDKKAKHEAVKKLRKALRRP